MTSPASPDPTLPGSGEVLTEAVTLGINLAGIGVALASRIVPIGPLPHAAATALTWADAAPRIRGALVRRLGPGPADVTLSVSTATANALSRRTFGLVVDATHRFSRLTEARARRRAWLRRRDELGLTGEAADDNETSGTADETSEAAGETSETVEGNEDAETAQQEAEAADEGQETADILDGGAEPTERPVPLPPGPVERYADMATGAAGAGFLSGLTVARDSRRAHALAVAALPKAARVGRDAYAAQVGRAAARRGVLIADPEALRRLDRVDTVVIDPSALLTGERAIDEVHALDAEVDADELRREAEELVDLVDPTATRQEGRWAVAPVEALGGEDAWTREARLRGGTVLALWRDDTPAGLVSVVPVLDPLVDALLASARGVGDVVLAGPRSGLRHRLDFDRVVPGGARLGTGLRALQGEGRGVVLVSGRGGAVLAAADVGIGVLGRRTRPPLGAAVLCGPGLAEVCLLLDAAAAARPMSRRSAKLAFAASTVAGLLAVAGPAQGAVARASVAVQSGAVIGLAVGTWAGMEVARHPRPVAVDRTPWHAMPWRAVLDRLSTSQDGLDEEEARRRANQAPALEEPEREGLARASIEELANPLTPALAGAAAVSASVGSVVDAAMIGTVLGVNALLGGMQRVGTGRALRQLGARAASRVRLRRGGDAVTADADRLVPGDVVEIGAGEVVPADCRLLRAEALEVDESSLTGESQLVAKSARPSTADTIADRTSMVYAGTVVAAGQATAVVVAAGAGTEAGRTARLSGEAPRPTGVEERLGQLTRVTLPVSIGSGAALMLLDLLRGRGLSRSVTPAVSLAVAAIPEGLPFVARLAELAAARRLSRRGALVRNPPTIEALGRVNALCFDKTGTLTEGRISLRGVSDGEAYRPVEELSEPLRDIVAAALRASPEANGRLPHPTDRAVVEGGQAAGVEPAHGAGVWTPVEAEPFESNRGYHAVIGDAEDGRRMCVKGAPEAVLDRCGTWSRAGGEVPFDAAARWRVEGEVEQLARGGFRLLAVAERRVRPDATFDGTPIEGLVLLGLLALADPARPTAAAAVDQLRQAGIDVVMVTGDHPSTAEAVAAELRILDGRRVVTGPELDAMDDAALAEALPGTAIFARVTPQQKVRIVRGLRDIGRIVAVTGDGANDAAAIRLADVGVALGGRATQAAREAADVVLVDDKLETITDAIIEGRMMWASVRDAVSILVGGNLGEIVFTVGSSLVGGGEALNARQLLLVNLLTDMLPALAVATRRPPGVTPETLLAEGPEASLGPVLTRDVYLRAGVTAGAATAALTLARITGLRGSAGTVALVALVGTQLGQTLTVTRRSGLIVASALGSLAALTVVVQTPGLSHLFGCRPLGVRGWTVALGTATAGTIAAPLLPRLLRQPVTQS
ncbi:cation-translocating P-type ATPase [Phytohabitans kaempferiae]|uniref:HAD-IC family P-type ATPase n=1 Tax=Phytohabitans kaempferiae TaxID=1620943 RepID=A0ABV6MAZ4_9ACTN